MGPLQFSGGNVSFLCLGQVSGDILHERPIFLNLTLEFIHEIF
jgi:hypothetical protein